MVDETQPVVNDGLARVAPCVVTVWQELIFGERRCGCRIGVCDLRDQSSRDLLALWREEIFRDAWQLVTGTSQIAVVLTFEFLEQADRAVFRMALEIDDTKLVRADSEMHADVSAFRQDRTPCRFELLSRHIVVTRVRCVETRIDVAQQWVIPTRRFVGIDTPLLLLEMAPVDVVEVLDQCVRGETGAKGRCDIGLGPAHDVDQRLPERFLVQRRVDYVRSRNDQRVQTLLGEILELEVVLTDMGFGQFATIELR